MHRTRTDPAIMRYGLLYLYFNSRSFRLAAKSLAELKKRSHLSIWKWVGRYSDCADRFRTDRRLVRTIFVDETLIQVDGIDYWLWIAYEPAINTCLIMHLSRERTIFVCYQLFKQLQNRYGRKPIFTDGAQWYNDACRWLRLQHYVYGTELKNMMRDLSSMSRTEQSVLMTIFHAESQNVTGSICMELVQIIHVVPAYGRRQNAIYNIPGQRWQLS